MKFNLRLLISIGLILFISIASLYVWRTRVDKQIPQTTISKTDKLITKLETQRSLHPKEVSIYISLSYAYLQKVRETADSSYYKKVDSLLTKAQGLSPENADVYAIRAIVAYGRHNFIQGLTNANRAVSINPNKPSYYGLLGDAQIELGNYDEAVSNFQKMVDLRPDYNS